MNTSLELFSLWHILILASIPISAGTLGHWARRDQKTALRIRIALGAYLAINELTWYGYVVYRGWVSFPYGLPLNLCDISLWLTVIAAFTLKPAIFELAYFWGIAGSGMAILTPDIGASFPSYPATYFFLAHGGVVVTLLTLTAAKMTRLRPGGVRRAFIILNIYASAIGIFNIIFKTNYFYLCEKPASASLLDYFGPWPWYILAGEIVGVGLFSLLRLPFRGSSSSRYLSSNSR